MSINTTIALLKPLPFFSGFNREDLKLIAFSADDIAFSAGKTLFEFGELMESAYVIARGEVELLRTKLSGEVTVVTACKAGDILGESALIHQRAHVLGARARTDVQLIEIHRSKFRRLLQEYPRLRRQIELLYIKRLAHTRKLLDDMLIVLSNAEGASP